MPMTTEDFDVFRQWLKKKVFRGGAMPACTMCGNKEWAAEGPVFITQTLNAYVSIGPGGLPAAPLALIVCTNCRHVVSFAWAPIKEEMSRGG